MAERREDEPEDRRSRSGSGRRGGESRGGGSPRGGGQRDEGGAPPGSRRGEQRGRGAGARGSGGRGGSERSSDGRPGRGRDGERGSREDGQRSTRGSAKAGRQPPGKRGDRGPVQRDQRADVEPEPPIDPDVTGRELDEDIRSELGTLSKAAAADVAHHLVMAVRLLDDDPERAYQHTLAARRRAARVGVVREASGVAAYTAGHYAEALAELRAARRITGSAEYLPMMADCERGLGRPRRALDLAADPAGQGLPVGDRIELLIVAAGARRDLGDVAAAVVSLQVPELRADANEPWVARLRYAYADSLEAAGRREEARRWFARAAEADVDEQTDAAERAAALGDASAGS